jgi:hypothetical protein
VFNKKTAAYTNLQELIDHAQAQLDSYEPDAPEYDKILDQIERLYKLQSREKETSRVSPDVIVTVIANLAGIALILNHERLHVVTSKALGFVVKSKL